MAAFNRNQWPVWPGIRSIEGLQIGEAVKITCLQTRKPFSGEIQRAVDCRKLSVGHISTGGAAPNPAEDAIPHLRCAGADSGGRLRLDRQCQQCRKCQQPRYCTKGTGADREGQSSNIQNPPSYFLSTLLGLRFNSRREFTEPVPIQVEPGGRSAHPTAADKRGFRRWRRRREL